MVENTDTRAGKHIFLACPLGKGPAQAEEGTQPIFAGSKKEIFDEVQGLLNKIGKPVYYVGDVEQSTAFKIISNLVGMANLSILSEGMQLGKKAGINPKLLFELLADTGANSYQLQLRGPWILQEDYSPRFSVNLVLKDVRLGVNMAEFFNQLAPFSELTMNYLKKISQRGSGEENCAAVYKALS